MVLIMEISLIHNNIKYWTGELPIDLIEALSGRKQTSFNESLLLMTSTPKSAIAEATALYISNKITYDEMEVFNEAVEAFNKKHNKDLFGRFYMEL